MDRHFVYILASRKNGTLYCGRTHDLARRLEQHRAKAAPAFTARYGVTRLVWFEAHDMMETARRRERAIKHWVRAWKIALIEKSNPEWEDLSDQLM